MNKKFFILTVVYPEVDQQFSVPISAFYTASGMIELTQFGVEKSELTAEEKEEVYEEIFRKIIEDINNRKWCKTPSERFATVFYSLT